MWSHHLTIAIRALRRDRGYALLNGVGLAVAFASCILIALFVRGELSFDRFHADADRLVVMAVESQFGQETETNTAMPYPLHEALEADVPAVEKAVLTTFGSQPVTVTRADGQEVGEGRMMMASPGFFEMFSFSLSEGDPARVLGQPNAAVVTESTARRLFGDENPVGQTIQAEAYGETTDLTITGVSADPPRTSTITFDIVASVLTLPADRRNAEIWDSRMWNTYALLAPGATVADLDRQLRPVIAKALPEGDTPRYFGVPMADYYLSDLSYTSGFRGNPTYLALFSAAALFLLLLGGINYVNLATARAVRRAREIGVRKAVGAGRLGVAVQFLTESVVLTVLSAAAAFGLAALLLPSFNAAFGSDLALADLDPLFVVGVAFASVVVGVLAGAYPALVLSGFSAARVLRGAPVGATGGVALRRVLVVVQFVVAIGLLAGTAVVLRQIAFTSETDLGFEQNGLVWLPLTASQSYGGERAVLPWEAAVDAVRAVPGVVEVVAADDVPGRMGFGFGAVADPSQPDKEFSFKVVAAEPGYTRTLGAEIIAGQDLDPVRPTVLLNEASVKLLGWTPAEAVGKPFVLDQEMTVAGVVQDYTFKSMRDAIAPVAIHTAKVEDGAPRQYQGVLVRLAPGQTKPAMDGIEAAFERVRPDEAFAPVFVDEQLASLYDADRRLGQVLGGFALVAILVACLGLVGLAAYTAERRTKEIGVRRVLGASVQQIVGLLTREYAVMVAVGAAVAVPLAILGAQRWLDGFVYRVSLGPGLFAGVVAGTFAVALLVVGGQALRAARRDPARSLRSE